MPRAERGESNSSSSSSLVYNFLSTNDPLLSELWVPTSCNMPTKEAAGGGAYDVEPAVHGKLVMDPSSSRTS